MPAPSHRFDDALEIAVRDLPPPADVEHDASIALLRFPCTEAEPVTQTAEPVTQTAEPITLDDFDDIDEDGDFDDYLLEPSVAVELDAGSSAGFELDEAEFEHPELDDEFEDAVLDDDMAGETLVDAAGETFVDSRGLFGAELEPEAEVEAEPEVEAELEPELEPADPDAHRVDPIRVPLWSGLNSFAYAVSRGLRGMGQSPLVQLLAVGTMAVCMLLLGTTTLILQNAQRVAHDLGVDTPVTVYMQTGADAMAIAQLRNRIAELPEVAAVEHVTPEAALARLEDGLGHGDSIAAVGEAERADLLAGIDASNLPDSLEIALVPGVDPGFADALATRIGGMSGVDEVSALGPWVQEVERMLQTLRWLAFGVAALVSLACLAIVWNTIRLGVFARRAEIDILRLVGGTSRFVRGPFVVEGVVQGVLGTALAIAGLWLGFELIRPFLERGMALMFAAGSLRFFSLIELGVALGFGAVLGLIGSRAAVARHA